MEKKYYSDKPERFETIRSFGVISTIVRLNVSQCSDEEHSGMWTCTEIEIDHENVLSRNDYGKIVSAIIRAKYSADDVEAIQQNYMESKTTEHKEEFYALRDWRKMAKEVATELTNTAE